MNAHIEGSDRTQFDAFASVVRTTGVGEIVEREPIVIYASGIDIGFFNLAFVRGPLEDPRAAVEGVKAYFAERALPFRIAARVGVSDDLAAAALDAGLHSGAPQEGMTLSPIPDVPDVEGLEVETVDDVDALASYTSAVARGFGAPEEAMAALLRPGLLADPTIVMLLGKVDGEPVATSLLCLSGEIAGVYNVATVPDFRRRGFGAALTVSALREGGRRGCTIGALQPSEMGRPVYARMGFRSAALYLQFLSPPPAPV